MGSCCIIAVKYTEPDWVETKGLIEQLNCPVIYVDRHGTGPLASAYNRGFKKLDRYGFEYTDYVWFVSNVTFDLKILDMLIKRMDKRNFAAIHPAFDSSDHLFCRPDGSRKLNEVPFVEFTAPIVRRDVYEQFMLDENMPYWGHDLDWGHRVRQAGYKIGVDHRSQIYHTYNRDLDTSHPDTMRRKANRAKTDNSTVRNLIRKYGHDWRKALCYAG